MSDVEQCPHPDVWFDRVLCPEPCGGMHDRCTECGVIVGHCEWEAEASKRRADLRNRMAQALAQHERGVSTAGPREYALTDIVLTVLDDS